MSSAFINQNDLDRLNTERQLTVQAPRIPIEDNKSPPDDVMGMTVGDLLVESLMNELERRFQ